MGLLDPLPGGVGPMTVAMLMNNTVLSAERYVNKLMQPSWHLRTLPLNLLSPVRLAFQVESGKKYVGLEVLIT